MGDRMRSVPFTGLLERISGELKGQKSIFSIPEYSFYRSEGKHSIKVFTQEAATPVGPAAGPHTQLAQNIITSYLAGARFIELKTVQIMDTLEIAKPCIDARDEGYNVEWSTEYTLPKAYDEYLKAWIIVHLLDMFMNDDWKKPSFIFNMSVGYNLEGIKTDRMQHFINSMLDADVDGRFDGYIASLDKALAGGIFNGTVFEDRQEEARKKLSLISKCISPSVTISTMHGCPPHEIEAICTYMLTEKKVDTFVKLNPTLLGYDTVRSILDDLGYDYIELRRESFEHDLQWDDAIAMLTRLREKAASEGKGFGVKLTNTLGNVNNGDELPGDERYMSGRALFPLSTSVARRLSEVFDGKLPVSYSGGASALNIRELFETGIRPITVATDLLHPGGYLKLKQMAEILDSSEAWSMDRIDVKKLEALNDKAVSPTSAFHKDRRGEDSVKIGKALPLTDCYVAPCVTVCPIHQDIPEYVYLMGEGRYAEALAVILEKNPLVNITGWICDHQCQHHCTRMDYEGSIAIREIKRLAGELGFAEYLSEIWSGIEAPSDVKAAVVGAGPAGLAASYFLARAGYDVSLFEREAKAGGVVENVIPEFRIPEEVVQKDVDFILSYGVKAHFSQDSSALTVEELRKKGFDWIFYAVGAEKARDSGIEGNGKIVSAVSFLKDYKKGVLPAAGSKVIVVGGGNTAMDASRAARKAGCDVTVIYRRSRKEMPCDAEEYTEALNDGVSFRFLANPVTFTDGVLTADKMKLGEKDSSGRARPVPSGEQFTLSADFVISAIGEKADSLLLEGLELEREDNFSFASHVFVIGDTVTGPSTVVRAIASAQNAVNRCIDLTLDEIADGDEDDECEDEECSCHDHEHHHHEHDEDCDCGCHDHEDHDEDEMSDEEYRSQEDAYFRELVTKKSVIREEKQGDTASFLKGEAGRCLECSYLCNKCVDVCPNRANVALDMRESGLFEDPFQILHIDAYCNECGNCETFCPYSGGPYRKKFTLFSSEGDFSDSTNDGFYVSGSKVVVRIEGDVKTGVIDDNMDLEIDVDERILAMISEVFISYPYLLGAVDAE